MGGRQAPGATLEVVGERTMSDEVIGIGDSVLYVSAMHEMVTVQGLKQGAPVTG